MNDRQTLLSRKSERVGKLSNISLPPPPEIPEAHLNRFPELRPLNEAWKRWVQNAEFKINQALVNPE
jgi:hypothetical protein